MKLTPWMLTVAAFGIIALLAVGFLAKKLFAVPVAEVKPPEPRVLPMAITAIEPGTMITRAHVGNGRAAVDQELTKDTFTSLDGVIGRIAKSRIEAAVPLEGAMFYSIGDHPGLTVAEGKQAVVVRVSETTAVLNQKLKPNQYVDVLLTIDSGGSGGGSRGTRLQSTGGSVRQNGAYDDSMTATLFRGVKLLSLSNGYVTTSLQGGDASSVTLELDERQAQIATLAQKRGEIDLVYNASGAGTGGLEIQGTDKDRITLQEILGIKIEEEKKPFRTEHYRGGGGGAVYFDENGDRLYGGGNDAGDSSQGTPLQSSSSSGWSTDTNPTDKSKDLAQTGSRANQ